MSLGIAIAAIALAAAALAAVVYFGKQAIEQAKVAGDEKEKRAVAEGGIALANRDVTAANEATSRALDGYRRQEQRADSLEEEIDAIESTPLTLTDAGHVSGRQRLREALRRQAALSSANASESGEVVVPEEGPARTPS